MLPLIFLSLIYKNVKDSDLRAYGLLKTCVLQILGANGRRASASPGLFPPYYDVDFPVKVAYGLYDGALEDSYKCSSYYLKPLIELLVRGNQREIITQNWREISFMQFEQFIPGKDWQYYLWRSPEGENAVILPEKTQSWGALTKNANNIKGDALPKGLRRFPDFIPFFVAVFPHRFDSEISGYLDLVSSKNSGTNEKTTQTV